MQKEPNKKSLNIFNDVSQVTNVLSQSGIGNIGKWRKDEVGYIASSSFYYFSENSEQNGMKNNLAYYLEGEHESKVDAVKVILNINNKDERDFSLDMFALIVIRTFMRLEIEIPENLIDSAKSGKNFSFENEDYAVIIEEMPLNIYCYKLTITTK